MRWGVNFEARKHFAKAKRQHAVARKSARIKPGKKKGGKR